jgi:hypothetical protein
VPQVVVMRRVPGQKTSSQDYQELEARNMQQKLADRFRIVKNLEVKLFVARARKDAQKNRAAMF